MERQEEEFERERRREEREERRATMATEKAARQQLEARMAALEESHRELQGQAAELAWAAAEAINALTDTRDEMDKELRGAIAKFDKVMAGLQDRDREAKQMFQFAREKIEEKVGEITDLPDFMPRCVN